jgi:hypothetical protein
VLGITLGWLLFYVVVRDRLWSWFTMHSFYVPSDTVVIFDRAICTRETGKEEGWILKIVYSGSAGSFDPLFKTETSVRTTRW